jgi:hypothetical protein
MYDLTAFLANGVTIIGGGYVVYRVIRRWWRSDRKPGRDKGSPEL